MKHERRLTGKEDEEEQMRVDPRPDVQRPEGMPVTTLQGDDVICTSVFLRHFTVREHLRALKLRQEIRMTGADLVNASSDSSCAEL